MHVIIYTRTTPAGVIRAILFSSDPESLERAEMCPNPKLVTFTQVSLYYNLDQHAGSISALHLSKGAVFKRGSSKNVNERRQKSRQKKEEHRAGTPSQQQLERLRPSSVKPNGTSAKEE